MLAEKTVFRGHPNRKLEEQDLKLLASKPWKIVDLNHNHVGESLGSIIVHLRNVVELDMTWNKLTEKEMVHISNLQSLRKLNLSLNNIGKEGISQLKKLVALESLNLQRCKLDSDSLAIIVANFPGLRVLQLGYNRLNQQQPLNNHKLARLEVLGLEECQLTNECAVEGLSKLPRGLLELNLRSNNLSGQSLANIVISLKELRRLYLGFNFVRDTGANLICFHLHKLQQLELSYCHLTDLSGLEIAKNLTKLKKLNLSSNKFTTATFNSVVTELKQLEFLSMNDNPIDNMDVLLTEEPIKLKKLQLEFHSLTFKEEKGKQKPKDIMKAIKDIVIRIKVAAAKSGCQLAITMP